MSAPSTPDLAMAYRYCYYVMFRSPISDADYDRLEVRAREIAPPDHPIHGIGSDQRESYSIEIIKLAEGLQ